jgi:hypothetical protein
VATDSVRWDEDDPIDPEDAMSAAAFILKSKEDAIAYSAGCNSSISAEIPEESDWDEE